MGRLVWNFLIAFDWLDIVTRLNRNVEYAFIALKYMSGKYAGQLTTVKEICDHIGIPFDATSRVMQQLAQARILQSEQGAHGGYMLARDLSKVSLLDVLEITSGAVEAVRCVTDKKDCEFFGGCNVTAPLKNLNGRLNEFYQTLSVAEILEGRGPS